MQVRSFREGLKTKRMCHSLKEWAAERGVANADVRDIGDAFPEALGDLTSGEGELLDP